jgi:tRNA nucleotidyltransferase (CCA-adding enzyme)
LSYHGYDLEFSSPRREFFHKDRLDHKNFHAELICNPSYIDSFSRRDLTINALGIELKKEGITFIDPFHGEDDLKSQLLRPISHDFTLDPVRFLRAIRFYFQLNFHFSEDLISELKTMDLRFLSSHYVKTEMLKTANSGAFWNMFRSLCFEWKISVSDDLKILLDLETHGETILTLDEWVISCHLNKPLSVKQFQTTVSYFQLSDSKLKVLLSFYDQALLLNRVDIIELQKKSWQDALKDPNLNSLIQLKDSYLKLKSRDLSFGLTKKQSDLLADLKLDLNLVNFDLMDFLKKHKIPVTYSSFLKMIFHLKSLSL